MIRIGCAIIAFFAWQANTALAGELMPGALYSNAIGRIMPYTIYLPDGYRTSGLRYPVLYLLHGAGGDEHSWPKYGHIKRKADDLIAEGAIPAAIIVMPGCSRCWWVDGEKEHSESAFWSELIPTVDDRYRTLKSRNGRLIAGLSAGGYGAVRYGLRYPDRVAAVAALSPPVYAEKVPLFSAARSQPQFLGQNGRFEQMAWDRQNYPMFLEGYSSQQYRVPFYLVSGNHDDLGIAREAERLYGRLRACQSKNLELHIVEGDHSWKVWEPAISGAMRFLFRFADRPRPEARTAGLSVGVSNR